VAATLVPLLKESEVVSLHALDQLLAELVDTHILDKVYRLDLVKKVKYTHNKVVESIPVEFAKDNASLKRKQFLDYPILQTKQSTVHFKDKEISRKVKNFLESMFYSVENNLDYIP